MRLKRILQEQQLESEAERLHSLLKDGPYYQPSVELYRGKERDVDKVLEKTTVSDKEREPRDTHAFLDEMLDVFFRDCYPQYPRRRESRFATEVKVYAKSYGDNLYIIYPHDNATLLCGEEDPLDIFSAIKTTLIGIDDQDIEPYLNGQLEITDEAKEVVQFIDDAFNYNLKPGMAKQIGCLDGMIQALKRQNEENFTDPLAITPMHNALRSLKKYFDSLYLGQPKAGEAGEVMFQGEYLQVPFEVQRKMLDMIHSGELNSL